MMNEKKMAKLAKQIAKYERSVENGINPGESEAKIQELIASLTPDELFAIDDYIMTHHLLSK